MHVMHVKVANEIRCDGDDKMIAAVMALRVNERFECNVFRQTVLLFERKRFSVLALPNDPRLIDAAGHRVYCFFR
jgi:hypothetical protein